MPTPAPFTPKTLATIRDMARVQEAPVIAEAISWELHRLARVAKAHGIELMNVDAIDRVVTQLTSTPGEPAPQRPIPAPLDEMIHRFPGRQRQVLEVLRRDIDGRWISGAEISERTGITAESLSNIVKAANRRGTPSSRKSRKSSGARS